MQHGSPSESPPSPNMSVVVDSSSPKHQARYTRQQNGSSSSSSSDNNNHNNTTTSSTLGSTTHPTFQSPVRNDAKLGGVNNNLIAFVRNRDIWVSTTEGYEVQLTTSSLQTDDPTLSSGTSEHVMQVIICTFISNPTFLLTIIGSGRIPKVHWLLLGTSISIINNRSNQSNPVLGDQ